MVRKDVISNILELMQQLSTQHRIDLCKLIIKYEECQYGLPTIDDIPELVINEPKIIEPIECPKTIKAIIFHKSSSSYSNVDLSFPKELFGNSIQLRCYDMSNDEQFINIRNNENHISTLPFGLLKRSNKNIQQTIIRTEFYATNNELKLIYNYYNNIHSNNKLNNKIQGYLAEYLVSLYLNVNFENIDKIENTLNKSDINIYPYKSKLTTKINDYNYYGDIYSHFGDGYSDKISLLIEIKDLSTDSGVHNEIGKYIYDVYCHKTVSSGIYISVLIPIATRTIYGFKPLTFCHLMNLSDSIIAIIKTKWPTITEMFKELITDYKKYNQTNNEKLKYADKWYSLCKQYINSKNQNNIFYDNNECNIGIVDSELTNINEFNIFNIGSNEKPIKLIKLNKLPCPNKMLKNNIYRVISIEDISELTIEQKYYGTIIHTPKSVIDINLIEWIYSTRIDIGIIIHNIFNNGFNELCNNRYTYNDLYNGRFKDTPIDEQIGVLDIVNPILDDIKAILNDFDR